MVALEAVAAKMAMAARTGVKVPATPKTLVAGVEDAAIEALGKTVGRMLRDVEGLCVLAALPVLLQIPTKWMTAMASLRRGKWRFVGN